MLQGSGVSFINDHRASAPIVAALVVFKVSIRVIDHGSSWCQVVNMLSAHGVSLASRSLIDLLPPVTYDGKWGEACYVSHRRADHSAKTPPKITTTL
jgi:hypothetical protein